RTKPALLGGAQSAAARPPADFHLRAQCLSSWRARPLHRPQPRDCPGLWRRPARSLIRAILEEQRQFFDTAMAPLFDKRAVRWATTNRLSLYGLGIPPAQYEALAGGSDMRHVLRSRLERLACGFSLDDNYFAWQAFGRSYAGNAGGPLPPYLR